jgi:hypothetical protein
MPHHLFLVPTPHRSRDRIIPLHLDGGAFTPLDDLFANAAEFWAVADKNKQLEQQNTHEKVKQTRFVKVLTFSDAMLTSSSTAKLAPPLDETSLIQSLVSHTNLSLDFI